MEQAVQFGNYLCPTGEGQYSYAPVPVPVSRELLTQAPLVVIKANEFKYLRAGRAVHATALSSFSEPMITLHLYRAVPRVGDRFFAGGRHSQDARQVLIHRLPER